MTEDGYESHFQVNHLSHFLLTLELLPLMVDSAQSSGDGRIVIVSSMLHNSGVFAPGNLNAERSYSRTQFYSNSKLFNVSDKCKDFIFIAFYYTVLFCLPTLASKLMIITW